MNDEAEYNIAVRYRRVKKHLENLGYKQALSLDALPLIENLLVDLIQTTDSLKHFKAIAQENIEVRCTNLYERRTSNGFCLRKMTAEAIACMLANFKPKIKTISVMFNAVNE